MTIDPAVREGRLRELAISAAKLSHFDIYRGHHRRPDEIVDGHTRDFETCPHPDCVLVRAEATAPETQGGSQVDTIHAVANEMRDEIAACDDERAHLAGSTATILRSEWLRLHADVLTRYANQLEAAAPVAETSDPCPSCHRPTRWVVNTSDYEFCQTCGQAFPRAALRSDAVAPLTQKSYDIVAEAESWLAAHERDPQFRGNVHDVEAQGLVRALLKRFGSGSEAVAPSAERRQVALSAVLRAAVQHLRDTPTPDARWAVIRQLEIVTRELEAAVLRAGAETERAYEELIYWLLGEREDFPPQPEPLAGRWPVRYWWRSELRKRFDAIRSARGCVASPAAPPTVTGDDASREAATRMSVRGPSPTTPLDLDAYRALARTHRVPRDPFAEQLSAAIFRLVDELEARDGR